MTSSINSQYLCRINAPAQYLGGEVNSIVKNDSEVDVHYALCFPDIYSVGMSYLGLQVLYNAVNQIPNFWAERVFMPLADMAQHLTSSSTSLSSLESQRALNKFDIVGFTLPHELCATTVLAMLSLGGISLRAKNRGNTEPIIIGGGPYALHAAAIAPFFDLLFLGEADEGLPKLLAEYNKLKCKLGGNDPQSRIKIIEQLSKMDGVYAPNISPTRRVKKCTIQRLDDIPYPSAQIIPSIPIIHDRLALEIMRGCVRGCRFCFAGFSYRPIRERNPLNLANTLREAIDKTGFDEVALLSLSSADYCSIGPLVKHIMDSHAEQDCVALSFPSMRVDALTPEMLAQVSRVRKTGFTLAPEGGSQRIRNVINKGLSDKDILDACDLVFTNGWNSVKLYFMLGLPTETKEDLEGIVNLTAKIRALPSARSKGITISASTFIPKPHTPFQWARQITADETIEKHHFLQDALRPLGATFKYQRAFASILEGLIARADESFADVIEQAFLRGSKLDAWDDFRSDIAWKEALEVCGIDISHQLRERDMHEPTSWQYADTGVSDKFLQSEWQKALREEVTESCLHQKCSNCGVCNTSENKHIAKEHRLQNIQWNVTSDQFPTFNDSRIALSTLRASAPVTRIRLMYSKNGAMRFVSHHSLSDVFTRASRRSHLPVCYTLGFHPLPKMVFGPPLQLGIASESEYVDIYFAKHIEPEQVIELLSGNLPHDIKLKQATIVDVYAPSLSEIISGFKFTIEIPSCAKPQASALSPETILLSEKTLQEKLNCIIERVAEPASPQKKNDRNKKGGRKKNKKTKHFVVGDFVTDVKILTKQQATEFITIEFSTKCDPTKASPKPAEIALALSGYSLTETLICKVETVTVHEG